MGMHLKPVHKIRNTMKRIIGKYFINVTEANKLVATFYCKEDFNKWVDENNLLVSRRPSTNCLVVMTTQPFDICSTYSYIQVDTYGTI